MLMKAITYYFRIYLRKTIFEKKVKVSQRHFTRQNNILS